MLRFVHRLCLFLLLISAGASAQPNASWTQPLKPFKIADNLYYVGGADLAAFLVTTPAGNILINANYAAEPRLIREGVEQLGFHWKDTKILLNGQAHADHMGGAAGVIRETGARDMVMAGDEDVVRSGGVTDFAFGPKKQFAPAQVDRVLHDGDTVTLGTPGQGGVVLTAHKTAGHTRLHNMDTAGPPARRAGYAASRRCYRGWIRSAFELQADGERERQGRVSGYR